MKSPPHQFGHVRYCQETSTEVLIIEDEPVILDIANIVKELRHKVALQIASTRDMGGSSRPQA